MDVVLIVLALASAAALGVFAMRLRWLSLARTRRALLRAWSSASVQGSDDDAGVMTLNLEDHGGDVVGTLVTSDLAQVFVVHARVGWFRTRCRLAEVRAGRAVPVADATLRLFQDDTLLAWSLDKARPASGLPEAAHLRPSDVGLFVRAKQTWWGSRRG